MTRVITRRDNFQDATGQRNIRAPQNYTFTKKTTGVQNFIGDGVIFSFAQGKEYGSYIDTDSDNAARDNTKNSGGLIENPVGVIEDVARESGIRGYQIKEGTESGTAVDSFDLALKTTLASWKFAGVIDTKMSSMQMLDLLAKQCGCILYFDNQNRLVIVPYDSNAAFTESGTDIPGDHDKYIYGVTSTGTRFDENPIVELSMNVTVELFDSIINEIFVNYNKNYGSGKLTQQTFLTATDSDDSDTVREGHAVTSQATFDFKGSVTIDAPYIRQTATAILLRNHIFDMRRNPRYVCVFRSWFNAISLQLGDIINIEHPSINNIISNRFIINAGRDALQVVESVAGDIDIVLTNDIYTGAELATEIETKLEAASALTYTVSFSTSTNKFTLIPSAGTISIDVSDSEATAYYIGFTTDPSTASSITSDTEVYKTRKWYVRRKDFDLISHEIEIEVVELI